MAWWAGWKLVSDAKEWQHPRAALNKRKIS